MIKNLNVKKYGSYQNFIWKNHIPDRSFKKFNIIYGRNYSGKTILSRMFRTLEIEQHHCDYPDADFEFILENESKLHSEDESIFLNEYKIRVFNSDFIKSNLSWLYNNDGSIEPFTVLGERNVTLEKEINKKNMLLGSEEGKIGLAWEHKCLEKQTCEAKQSFKNLKKKLDSLLADEARKIKDNQRLYNRTPYRKPNLESDITKTGAYTELSEKDYNILVSQLDENKLPKIEYIPLEIDDFIKTITTSIKVLNSKVSISKPIQDFLNDSVLSSWVQEGINIHKNKNMKCKFCGHTISQDTWDRLTQHFNKESEKLQKQIEMLIVDCKTIETTINSHVTFTKKNIYLAYGLQYSEIMEKWNTAKENIRNELNSLVTKLKNKQQNITKQYTFVFDFELLNIVNNISIKLEVLIKANNNKGKLLEDDKIKIHNRILMSEIIQFLKIKKIDKLGNDIKIVEEQKKTIVNKLELIDIEIKSIKKEIESMELQGNDESMGAKRVNQYLKKCFGNEEISLLPVETEGITRYKVTRSSSEAKNLSDGESSLISFCYFIAKIEDLLKTPAVNTIESMSGEEVAVTSESIIENKAVVYIDDPISSLDNNHIFFVFSIIKEVIAKSSNLNQLFISTHNLDFLKYLKKLNTSRKDKCNVEYFLITIEKQQNNSRSCIKLMPKHLREYVTEFNYLFSEMYKLYQDTNGDRRFQISNTYNQYYSLPNNIRKFLELYLFYRYPDNSTLFKKLEKMFSGNIPIIINRVINEYSHLTYIERAWKPFDVPELEDCVKIILDKIKEHDQEQFDMLVSSIE